MSLLPSVAFAGFRVSSFKKENHLSANTWNAAAALDSDPTTCWMVDPEQPNEGSWFEIDIPKSALNKLSVDLGWDKDDKTFYDYPRAKTIKVEVFDEAQDDKKVLEHTVTFEDKRGWQSVDLPETKVGNEVFGGKVRLTITAIYPGKDYPNLAMSEILLGLADFDAPAKLETPPTTTADGHPGDNLIDGEASTYWLSDGDGAGSTFTVKADGFGVDKIGLQAGPKGYAHPKTIKIEANDLSRTYTMQDDTDLQWFVVPPIIGYTGSGFGTVKVTVIDTYPGSKPGLAIAEAQLEATNYGGL